MQALIVLATTLVAGALSGALLASIYLRSQWKRFLKEFRTREAEIQQTVSRVEAEWEKSKLDRASNPLPPLPANGFNINRRAEALRRLGNGHAPDHIAAASGFTAAEMDLLDKVNRIARARPGEGPTTVSPRAAGKPQ